MDEDRRGSFAAVLTVTATAAILIFVLFVTLLAAVSSEDGEQAWTGDNATLNPAGIPAEYIPWIIKAGQLCPHVSAPLIAAQIKAESGFRDWPPNHVGAAGPAQFLASTWAAYGVDGDGDGDKDLHSVPDAVMAMANLDCASATMFAATYPDNLIDIILAAYNAGAGAVMKYGGVPPYPETMGYVARIKTYMAEFTAQSLDMSAPGGGWQWPLDRYTISAEFGRVGPWTWTGYHTGTDFAAPVGTSVKASASGVVAEVNPVSSNPHGSAWGNQVIIDHGTMTVNGRSLRVSTTYNHLARFSVKEGQQVNAGALVGVVGMTGNTFGPHLHMEVHTTAGAFPWGSPKRSDFADPAAFIKARLGNGDAIPRADGAAGRAVSYTQAQLGKPYVWGAVGPDSFDCSGLVVSAWKQATGGTIVLPRTTFSQVRASSVLKEVPVSQMKPGDLIFFKIDGSWSHVGLYVGNGQMIHAPRPGKSVTRESITSGWYGARPQTARRVVVP